MEELGADELAEWGAADRLGLLPDPWLETGMICSVFANVSGGRSKNKKSFSPTDFMPGQRVEKKSNARSQFLALCATTKPTKAKAKKTKPTK